MNLAKFSAQSVGKMLDHFSRAQDENGEYITYPRGEGGAGHIHRERTNLNYVIGECHDLEWIENRLKDVYQRPGQKSPVRMCDIVVTMPESEPEENQEAVMRAAYDSLAKMYGQRDNIVGGFVHRDETSTHLHFSFLPISIRKPSKNRPETTEKLSVSDYWPKKNSLQEMHRQVQADVDRALGHHVELTYAEKDKDRDATNQMSISQYKAATRQLANGRTDKAKAEAVRKERGGTIRKKEVYYEVPEKSFAILAAQSRAAEMAKDEERAAEKREEAAKSRAAKAEAEKATAEAARIELSQEAAIYIDAPPQIKQALEGVRREHIAKQRNMQRDCVRVFLSSGRDFEAALTKMRPVLAKMGIREPSAQRSYMKKSLSAAMRQLKREYKISKSGEVMERKKNVPARKDSQRGGGSSGGGGGSSWSAEHNSTDYLHNEGTTEAVALGGRLDEGHEDIGPWSMLSPLAKADKNMEELMNEI